MASGGRIPVSDTAIEYIKFGSGPKNMLMIPGVGDGFKTVKGMAVPFSMMYSEYSKDFTVYVMSRRNRLPEGFNNRQMAADVAICLKHLGIDKINVLGVSQGGMITQWLAIDYPELLDKIILCASTPKLSEERTGVINCWLGWAGKKDYKNIFIDTTERSYTEKKLKGMRPFYGLMAAMTKPKTLDRFIVNAEACISQDSTKELAKINVPTLVIGGRKDNIVGPEGSYELASAIPGAQIHMYENYGHGLYEEAKDFNKRVMEFFRG